MVKGGEEFDRFTGEQLIGQLSNEGRPLNIDGFADMWIEAEKRILNRISKNEQETDRLEVICS